MKINIDIGYPSLLLFSNVCLKIPDHGILSFVGDNGSGKSTLFKTLTGLLKPLKGSIPQSLIEQSFIISDYVNIPDEIKVKDILTLLDKNQYVKAKKQYRSVYRYVEKLYDSKVRMLSSGERKIIEIFSALAVNKKYLFLDEALSNLDYFNKGIVLDIIKDITKMDITVFYISHSLEEIIELPGDVLCLLPRKKKIVKLDEEQKDMETIQKMIRGAKYGKAH